MSDEDFTHLDSEGRARMVNVGDKPVTVRVAKARAVVTMSPDTARAMKSSTLDKGDALTVARLAGVMGAKRTPELIPLCHALVLDHVGVEIRIEADRAVILTEARCEGRTGVEMEALTAATTAALTLYDMAKSRDRSMAIAEVVLLEKSGGRSGTWIRPDDE
jgi:cyclic pyranopterin phosphate synthase